MFILLFSNIRLVIAKEVIDNFEFITFVPIRDIFSRMEFNVEWDKNNSSVLLFKDNIVIILPINKKYLVINGDKINIEYPTLIFNGKAFCSSEIFKIIGYEYELKNNKMSIHSKLDFSISIGNKAPNFKLKDINNNEISLKDFEGKKVVVVFWTSWCPYCRREIQSVNALLNKINKDEIIILPINVGEDSEIVKKFMNINKYDFTVLLDENMNVSEIYNIESIPTMIFIDEDGNVYDIQKQYCNEKEIKQILGLNEI